ncbi:hypothetical protein [Ochrobactrum sp. BTU1]|uniref:hypothetical protein n=1 Tax=Ochrobactrum sp. BTU1 TaxID=2840456 RepID=UPI001C03DB64|nr:hypothetical protein KMS41_26145 [Ochrobactrum sp. BTU1]
MTGLMKKENIMRGIFAVGIAIAVSGCGTPGADKQANLSAKTQKNADRFIGPVGSKL